MKDLRDLKDLTINDVKPSYRTWPRQAVGAVRVRDVRRHVSVELPPIPGTGVPRSQETAPPLGTPEDPTYSPTVGSQEGGASYERSNPVARRFPDTSSSVRT